MLLEKLVVHLMYHFSSMRKFKTHPTISRGLKTRPIMSKLLKNTAAINSNLIAYHYVLSTGNII